VSIETFKNLAEIFKVDHKQRDMIRQEVYMLATQAPISKFVWDKLYINTYERNFLLEFVSDEVLLEQCQLHMNNITTNYTSTYEGAILHKLFPEVCKRLKEKIG
jgi:carbon starvation protein CstA